MSKETQNNELSNDKALHIAVVINWVAVSDSLPDHLEKVVMYGKRTEHNEPEIITGVLNRAGGLNDWNTYGIIMHEVTYWAKIKPPCLYRVMCFGGFNSTKLN